MDRFLDSRMTSWGLWNIGSGGTEQKGKRTHERGQQYDDCWGKGAINGLNCNGKNTINK